MKTNTSQISLTSKVQELSLKHHEASHYSALSRIYHGGIPAQAVLNAVIGRLAALLLSPAAALDFTFHLLALPCSFVYAIGKSIYLRKADFSLPWEHLQRVREAVFPILFGSVFGLIHPYLGIYATEPKTKHIGIGYLLSKSDRTDVVISPVAAYKETVANMRTSAKASRLPKEYSKLTREVMDWEKSLEEIQSIEMFDFKITRIVMGKILKEIDQSYLSKPMQAIVKRVSLLAYPALATLDLTAAITISSLFAITGVVQLIGGKSPAYLETTSSPLLHIYNLGKVILSTLGLTVGFFASLVSPEHGLKICYPSSKSLGMVPLLLKLQFFKLSRRIKSLKNQERMLLPVVIQNDMKVESELDIIPSNNSHMTYLLIEKNNGRFSAELIERGSYHGARENLTESEVLDIAKNCLSLRFSSTNKSSSFHDYFSATFHSRENIIDLGNQHSLANCVITNLFATFDVINARDEGDQETHQARIRAFKQRCIQKYKYFMRDFFPYAPMSHIVAEAENLQEQHI